MALLNRVQVLLARLMGPLAQLRRKEDGSATIEFVILFPAFMSIFLASFESGLLMTRYVMLDRGLDLAVRSVRLGTNSETIVDAELLKTRICNHAGIIPDCMSNVKVEMLPIDPFTSDSTGLRSGADCIDRDDPTVPNRTFTTGTSNQMMILRVCALFDPFFPTGLLGQQIATESGSTYALVSTSAFVMEP